MIGSSISALICNAFMRVVSPCVHACEKDDSWGGVTDERKLAPKLGHPQLGIEHVAEKLLLVGRREVLDLSADARRYLRRHPESALACLKSVAQLLQVLGGFVGSKAEVSAGGPCFCFRRCGRLRVRLWLQSNESRIHKFKNYSCFSRIVLDSLCTSQLCKWASSFSCQNVLWI